VGGTYRLLNNVMGLWILQQCRKTWQAQGQDYSYADLVAGSGRAIAPLFHQSPMIPVFCRREIIPQKVRDFCAETGQPVPADTGVWCAACWRVWR
jgi:rhamnulokinase